MSRYWDIDKDIEEFPNMYTAHEFHDEDKEASADLFYQSAGGMTLPIMKYTTLV